MQTLTLARQSWFFIMCLFTNPPCATTERCGTQRSLSRRRRLHQVSLPPGRAWTAGRQPEHFAPYRPIHPAGVQDPLRAETRVEEHAQEEMLQAVQEKVQELLHE
jgi:hypothetical protein